MEKNDRYKFYEEIMTYAIRYGRARANWKGRRADDNGESEEEMDIIENEMRAFIKAGLDL